MKFYKVELESLLIKSVQAGLKEISLRGMIDNLDSIFTNDIIVILIDKDYLHALKQIHIQQTKHFVEYRESFTVCIDPEVSIEKVKIKVTLILL